MNKNKKENKEKIEELASKLGMQFEDVVELLSEETLNSMLAATTIEVRIPNSNGEYGNCSCGPCNRGSNCVSGKSIIVKVPVPKKSEQKPEKGRKNLKEFKIILK
jgi:hypothetical protein